MANGGTNVDQTRACPSSCLAAVLAVPAVLTQTTLCEVGGSLSGRGARPRSLVSCPGAGALRGSPWPHIRGVLRASPLTNARWRGRTGEGALHTAALGQKQP